MAKSLKELLAKDKELRIGDLKLMLEGLKIQNKERIDYREHRNKEVHGMLSDLKKERLEAAGHWKAAQSKMTQRRAESITP